MKEEGFRSVPQVRKDLNVYSLSAGKEPKVWKTLMCNCTRSIKDLKDLKMGTGTFFYRHAGPKGPEEEC